MNAFTKVVRIGTMDTGNKIADIHCKVKFDGNKLSISGVVGALKNGNALGGAGQIDMEFAHLNQNDNDERYTNLTTPDEIVFAPGWNAAKWYKFLAVWKRWHLNDMRAGDKHQEDVLRAVGSRGGYTNAKALLAEYNLYDSDGYKYGHAWKEEVIAEDALQFLYALPNADKQPVWI